MEGRQPFNMTRKALSPQPHSPWHSPVPYLFGGLAAMLGLIAFALLILACSYWKLSGYLDNGDGGDAERDLEAGEDDAVKKPPPVFEEKILVIMAGDVKPTFIATPASSRSSSFGDTKSSNGEEKGGKCVETAETKEGSSDQVQHGNSETQETSDQSHQSNQSQ